MAGPSPRAKQTGAACFSACPFTHGGNVFLLAAGCHCCLGARYVCTAVGKPSQLAKRRPHWHFFRRPFCVYEFPQKKLGREDVHRKETSGDRELHASMSCCIGGRGCGGQRDTVPHGPGEAVWHVTIHLVEEAVREAIGRGCEAPARCAGPAAWAARVCDRAAHGHPAAAAGGHARCGRCLGGTIRLPGVDT